MREIYRCPVEGCSKVFKTEAKLRGHVAGMMQYDDDHKWENIPITHTDLSNAKKRVPGFD